MFFAQPFVAKGDPAAALREYLGSVVTDLLAEVPGAVQLGEIEPVLCGSGTPGLRIDITLPTPAMPRVRRIAVFLSDGYLFTFHCDAIPPMRFFAWQPKRTAT